MNWNKGTLFETSGSYWKSCTLHTGVKLDIFTIIGAGNKSPEDIAKKINGSISTVSIWGTSAWPTSTMVITLPLPTPIPSSSLPASLHCLWKMEWLPYSIAP